MSFIISFLLMIKPLFTIFITFLDKPGQYNYLKIILKRWFRMESPSIYYSSVFFIYVV